MYFLKSIDAHRSAIISMANAGRLMFTGSQDGTAKCWVTEFGDNTVVYKEHRMSVTSIKFYKELCEYKRDHPKREKEGI